MRKKPRFLLVPLLLAVVAWSVNWKLDHPAPTAADAAFARLIHGADEVEIATFSGKSKVTLRGTELAEFIGALHFENQSGFQTQGYDDYYTFTWKKKGVALSTFDTDFDVDFGNHSPSFWKTNGAANSFNHQLSPRSGSHLMAKVHGFHLNPFG